MSISKEIKISFIWNKDNFLKAFESAYSYEFKNSVRRYIGWLFIAMAQFGVVFALKGGKIALLMLSTILIIYWYYIKKILIKRKALKEFENSTLKNKKINLIFDEDGIKQNEKLIKWRDVKGIVEINDGFLLYINSTIYYIPFNAFTKIEDKSELKKLLKEKGKLYE